MYSWRGELFEVWLDDISDPRCMFEDIVVILIPDHHSDYIAKPLSRGRGVVAIRWREYHCEPLAIYAEDDIEIAIFSVLTTMYLIKSFCKIVIMSIDHRGCSTADSRQKVIV